MASRRDLTTMEPPTTLENALERIKLLVEEVKRKEKAIKTLQKANGASRHEVAELKRDKEENDKIKEREKLKEEIKREVQQSYEEKEQARRRMMRDEREMRDYLHVGYTTKRYRQDEY